MLLKRQQIIANKVSFSPTSPVSVDTRDIDLKLAAEPAGKLDETAAKIGTPEETAKPVQTTKEESVKSEPFVKSVQAEDKKEEKLETIEKVEEKVATVAKAEETMKPEGTVSPISSADSKLPTANSGVNPNALLELTKADIFKLLGMFGIPETEKKKNLDEMEETIWADFVEEDLPKMLKPDEKGRFEDLLKTAPSAEKVINFFGNPPSGGLPSNFEEKYLAKTLEFKAEIAKEQIATLLESTDDPAKKETLQKAKDLAVQGYWKQVEDLMTVFG